MNGIGNRVSHGGDLDTATRRFGLPEAGWLDLSTGINPHPYPVPALSPEIWSRLPQRSAEAALIAAARACYGVPEDARMVAAPGTQALIQALPRLRPAPARVAVLAPTYGEHAHVWRVAGHAVRECADLEAAADCDIAIVVNPNNPDGRVTGRGDLLALCGTLARRGGWLVLDEAFADTDPALSLAGESGRNGLVILRSFGKFYGLAGTRLGFALADEKIAGALDAWFGPWAVSGPAIEIGRTALADKAWAIAMRARLADEAARLDALLEKNGMRVVGGTSLFRLVETSGAASLYEALGRRGILVRVFADRPDLVRIGLPGGDDSFDRLAAALAAIRG